MVYAPRSAATISHVRSERHIANRVRFSHITRRVSPLTLDLRVRYRPPFTCQTHTTTGQQIRYAQNMRISPALTLVAIPCLILSGCSSDTGSQEQPATITVTQTTMATDSPAPEEQQDPVEKQPESEEKETQEVAPPSPAQTARYTINPGQIGGDCGTTADGLTLSAGDATSCEFAGAMYEAGINAEYRWRQLRPDINGAYGAELTVASPITKETYEISCAVGSDQRYLGCGVYDDNSVHVSVGPVTDYGGWTSRLSIVEHQPQPPQ